MSAAPKPLRLTKTYANPRVVCRLRCALLLSLPLLLPLSLPLLLGGCGKKDTGILVLDAQSREALSIPRLRPLALPPRYNLDGGEGTLSRPAASLTDQRSVRLSELAPPSEGLAKGHKDAAFLKRLRLERRDPEIRRRIAEETQQAVPLSQPLLDAILQNSRQNDATQP